MSLYRELKRRNVFRVGIAYIVAAWLLLQVADVLIQLLELPPGSGKMVILLLVIGFVPALILAWAFELTPEGIKREHEVDRTRSVTPQAGKKLDRAIIAILGLVVVWFLVDEFYLEPREAGHPAAETAAAGDGQATEAPAAQPPDVPGEEPDSVRRESVAVLPFTAMSSGEDDGYFADGLTEEILNSLTRLPELLVTARTSSFHFKGRDLPIPEIAKTLGVDHVVEGSVRRAGERVRITAQLIRANDGFHLWSDTYDRTLEDVFAVQEDIAANIAETLDVVLDEDKRQRMRDAGIGDVEAFIAYQKGLEAFVRAHEDLESASENLLLAVENFDQALSVEKDLVSARVMKADQRGHVIFELASGLREESRAGELDQTLDDLRNEYALAIQASPPGNQRHILELEAAMFGDDWSDMRAKLERALQPGDCPMMNWSVDFAAFVGYYEALLTKTGEILRCDPLNFLGLYGRINALLLAGDAESAVEAAQPGKELEAGNRLIADLEYIARLAAGQLDGPEVQGKGSDSGFFMFNRQIPRQVLLGNRDAAVQMAEEFRSGPFANDWSSMIIAAMLGDRERANRHAARIDAWPGSTIVLVGGSFVCACGAPFELEATPNLKARIEQSGLPWPPPPAIRFPDKGW